MIGMIDAVVDKIEPHPPLVHEALDIGDHTGTGRVFTRRPTTDGTLVDVESSSQVGLPTRPKEGLTSDANDLVRAHSQCPTATKAPATAAPAVNALIATWAAV